MTTPEHPNQPAPGDVLITTDNGVHLISVVPYADRVSFTQLSHAVDVAERWAEVNRAKVWRKANGQITNVKRS